jgi:6-pyruvoyltetrahydropterin/6-carboxytetrahydropterin synthase
MTEAYLTRVVHFSAAHRYWRNDWDEAENRRVFGACANAHGHGHNYRLEVTVGGPVDPRTGFVVDLGILDELLQRAVIEPLDHRHLNHDVAEFAAGGTIPTTENILVWLWPRIRAGLPGGTVLHRLRLREDDTLWADYFGEEPRGERASSPAGGHAAR